MTGSKNPLSPHLQIYGWNLLMAFSILHRVSGFLAAVGFFIWPFIICCIVISDSVFDTIYRIMYSHAFVVALFLWFSAVCFHLANGVRYCILVWFTQMSESVARYLCYFAIMLFIALEGALISLFMVFFNSFVD